jgi:hypothetical protein
MMGGKNHERADVITSFGLPVHVDSCGSLRLADPSAGGQSLIALSEDLTPPGHPRHPQLHDLFALSQPGVMVNRDQVYVSNHNCHLQ